MLQELLDNEARRINSKEFISSDPVQFPRRYDDLRDIEISAFLCSSIAWGNRKMICRNCDRLLSLMGNQPYHFMMDGEWEEWPDGLNIHRTFFVKNLKNYLRGLKAIYNRHGSIEGLAHQARITSSDFPSWSLVKAMNEFVTDSRCLPQNLETTALKRVNMALRWLVRNDGIVDMGCWKVISPARLFIPLDVHVANTARELGLLQRKSADKKAVIEIMEPLRKFNPDDPAVYDFALFGIGMGL